MMNRLAFVAGRPAIVQADPQEETVTTLPRNPSRSSGFHARSCARALSVVAALALAAGIPATTQAAWCSSPRGGDSCAVTDSVRQDWSGTRSPAGAEARPFSGFLTGRSEIHPTTNPIIYTGSAHAAGMGTHIGAFTKVTDDVVDLSTGWTVGSFAMTVAGGAQVRGEYQGFVLIDFFAGTFTWVLDATITGGTGRFAHAFGEFVFEACGMFVVLPDASVRAIYSETFDGTIAY